MFNKAQRAHEQKQHRRGRGTDRGQTTDLIADGDEESSVGPQHLSGIFRLSPPPLFPAIGDSRDVLGNPAAPKRARRRLETDNGSDDVDDT